MEYRQFHVPKMRWPSGQFFSVKPAEGDSDAENFCPLIVGRNQLNRKPCICSTQLTTTTNLNQLQIGIICVNSLRSDIS